MTALIQHAVVDVRMNLRCRFSMRPGCPYFETVTLYSLCISMPLMLFARSLRTWHHSLALVQDVSMPCLAEQLDPLHESSA
jgi:hypothetical protein